MNSSLQKALAASIVAVGGSASALGQSQGNQSGKHAAGVLKLSGQSIASTAGSLDWDQHCIDPNNTAPYSADFGILALVTPFREAGIGISGTVTYKFCNFTAQNGYSMPVAGRFGLANGPQGSIQDDFRLANGDTELIADNGADFMAGMNDSIVTQNGIGGFIFGSDADGWSGAAQSGSGFSFADVTTQAVTGGNVTQTFYGGNGFNQFWIGDSNRYMHTEEVQGSLIVDLDIDVIGDAARCTWSLWNNGTAATNVGLYYSQWIYIAGGYASTPGWDYFGVTGQGGVGFGPPNPMGWSNPQQEFTPYILIPGHPPVQVETRYIAASDPANFPSAVEITGGLFSGDSFTSSPSTGPGYQVVNQPIQDVSDVNGVSDQTPVDEFVIGDPVNTLAGLSGSTATPKVADQLVPDVLPGGDVSYTQKWYPQTVQPGYTNRRTIVTYYRSQWADTDYSQGYTVVVDTPKVIPVSRTNAVSFNYPPNALTSGGTPYLPIQVSVDNTGPFGIVYQNVTMTNVKVTLQLPQGLYDANNVSNQTMISFIPTVQPKQIASTTFQITVDPTLQTTKPLQYTVTVQPTPGATKTITGYISIGGTARLVLDQGANLVGSPWTFAGTNNQGTGASNTWENLLAPLVPETDYQVFQWDAAQGGYVIATNASRGQGYWVVSTANHGSFPLSGSPQVPTDEFPPATGIGTIQLQPGWNLIANPYNYAIPLGQLLGIPSGTGTVYTYDQLVQQNVFDGTMAYYDPVQQTYNFLQSDTDEMAPNFGYWIFLNQGITLQFPPVTDLFVRRAGQPSVFKQRYNNWKLQLATTQGTLNDKNNFVGFTTNLNQKGTRLYVRKAPISPVKGAMRSAITNGDNSGLTNGQGPGTSTGGVTQYSQLMHTNFGRQSFNYSVYSEAAGPTTISWPNLAQIPDNLQVTLTDRTTGQQINARSQAGYTYYAASNAVRNFAVAVTPLGTQREAVGTVATAIRRTGDTLSMPITFGTTVRGGASLYVYQGSKLVGTIVNNMDIVAGTNSLVWPMTLSNGRLAPSGNYTIAIVATGEGGDTATKLVNVTL